MCLTPIFSVGGRAWSPGFRLRLRAELCCHSTIAPNVAASVERTWVEIRKISTRFRFLCARDRWPARGFLCYGVSSLELALLSSGCFGTHSHFIRHGRIAFTQADLYANPETALAITARKVPGFLVKIKMSEALRELAAASLEHVSSGLVV